MEPVPASPCPRDIVRRETMRVRIVASLALVAMVVGLAALLAPGAPVNAKLQDAATPAANGTPVATAESKLGVVTLVAWYVQDPNGGPLKLGPLRTNNSLVANQET